jgi:hypothetical protein
MDITKLDFHVLGIGHLAAAVRVQLRLRSLSAARGLSRDGGDFDVAHAEQSLFLACSDYESSPSFADVNRRAVDHRSPILFARLSDGGVKVGPLVVPLETSCFACRLPRRWDFSLSRVGLSDLRLGELACNFMSARTRATLNPDTHLASLAHFGALLVAREISELRFGAGVTRLAGCVAKFDPRCIHPEIAAWHPAPDCAVCGADPTRIPATG